MKNKYDQILQDKIPHLKLHPNYLPHIGKNYSTAKTKVFIVAESHYLDKQYNNEFSAEEWYENPKGIYERLNSVNIKHQGWFNTRGVIKDFRNNSKLKKGHAIFNNLESAYSEINSSNKLFDDCVYFNYFQRPAELQGDSIRIRDIDKQKAFENIEEVVKALKPHKIIFVSKLAYTKFSHKNKGTQEDQIKPIPVYCGSVPHPTSAWWNRKSKKYGLKGEKVTGRDKFIRIITPKI